MTMRLLTLDTLDDPPILARVVDYWNGFAVPELTFAELSAYYRRIGITDSRLIEDGDTMRLESDDTDPMVWSAVGTDDEGRNVYHVDGLVWTHDGGE